MSHPHLFCYCTVKRCGVRRSKKEGEGDVTACYRKPNNGRHLRHHHGGPHPGLTTSSTGLRPSVEYPRIDMPSGRNKLDGSTSLDGLIHKELYMVDQRRRPKILEYRTDDKPRQSVLLPIGFLTRKGAEKKY